MTDLASWMAAATGTTAAASATNPNADNAYLSALLTYYTGITS